MTIDDIEAWAASASVERAEVARIAVMQAYGDWLERIALLHELHDLTPWSVSGFIQHREAARAASVAAAEMAIICWAWPGRGAARRKLARKPVCRLPRQPRL